MRKTIAGFLAGVVLTLGGVWLSLPHCPEEDSCRGDYQTHWFGNIWTGVETEH